jgi:hypothetical protein
VIDPQTTTIAVGQAFTITLQVEAGTQPVDGVSTYVDFDPTRFQVQAITPDTSKLPVTIENSHDNVVGRVNYSAGAFSNFPSGTFAVARVRLVALAETAASPLTFQTVQPRKSDVTYNWSSVLRDLRGGTVTAVAGTIEGHLTFQRPYAAPHPSWSVPVTFSLYAAGRPAPSLLATPTTDQSGVFTLPLSVAPGAYDACAKNRHTLQSKTPVTLTWGANVLNLSTLREGDANNDNIVNILDFSGLVAAFGRCAGGGGYDDRPDFNEDDCVTILDFSLLASNFGQMGATCGGGAALNLAPESQPSPARGKEPAGIETGTVEISLLPTSSTVMAGDVFTLTIQVTAGAQLVDGVAAYVDFDPIYLQVQAITPDLSVLPMTLQNNFDNVAGQVDYAAGTFSNFPSGSFNVPQVRFVVVTAPPANGTALTFHTVVPRQTDATYVWNSVLGATHGATVNGVVLAAPVIRANKVSNGIELRWTQTQSGIVRYEVWRSTDPYFMPGEAGSQKFISDPPTPGMGNEAIFMDAFGEPLPTNYYYVVVAVGAGEATSPPSNRVAAFHFTLTPGAP